MDEFHSEVNHVRPDRLEVRAGICNLRGARVTSVMRLRADKGEEDPVRDYPDARASATQTAKKGSLPGDDRNDLVWRKLFDTLQGDVRRLYDEAQHASTVVWIY